MKRDIEELKFNLRTGDPDTYFMCANVILCLFVVYGIWTGWI